MGNVNDFYILFSWSLNIAVEPLQRSSCLKIIFESDEDKEPFNHDQYGSTLYTATVQSDSEIECLHDPENFDRSN